MAIIDNTQSLKAGILSDLKDTWRQEQPTYEAQQKKLMKFLSASTIRNATYVFKESTPFPKKWPYGKGRIWQALRDRFITMGKTPFDLSVAWSIWDARDDQIARDDIRTHVQACVKRYLLLPFVLLSEYFNGTAVLNDSIINAYDGAALFSATSGDGSNRYGAAGGNIITGSGLTVAGVLHDIALAQRRFLDFVDPTAEKPLWDAKDVEFPKLCVIGPNSANEIFQKAAKSEFIRSDPANNTSESNYLMGTFEWELNPFLTDSSDYYVQFDHPYYKPFMFRGSEELESFMREVGNSDHAREFFEEGFLSNMRVFMAPFFPGCIIKINN